MTATDAVHKITDLTFLESIKDEWKYLEGRASRYSQCQTYDYCELVAEVAISLNRSIYLITARDDRELVGVWLLTLEREGWLRILRAASCGTNEEYSSPLIVAANQEIVAQRIFALAVSIPADQLKIYNASKGGFIDRAAAAINRRRSCGPIQGTFISAAQFGSWQSLADKLPKKFKAQMRNDVSNLSEAHEGILKIGWCDSEEEAIRTLEFYFRNKRAWLKRTGRHAPWASSNEVERFFGEMARATDHRIAPFVACVSVPGKPISAAVCLLGSDAVEFYMTTFDEQYKEYSPGTMLIRWLIEWSLDRGLDFDFRIMMADYKKRWHAQVRTYHTYTIALTTPGRIPSVVEMKSALKRRAGAIRRILLSATR